jgi:acetylornithine deacetylase/succinyl-diaminopimelate desuccinylase
VPAPERLRSCRDALDGEALVALAGALIRLPSHPGVERQEEAVAQALAAWLGERGVVSRLVEVVPGRPNLYATLRAPGPGPHLMLCGHTDTVPLNAGDPGVGFRGEVEDGRLVGRGAADMKGALAAMASALVALRSSGALRHGAVTLAAVVDEEMQSLGAEHLVRSGERADAAVVGESTGNRIAVGHRGLEWLEIELTGRAAHGGRPREGVSAVVGAARFVEACERELPRRFAARTHPVVGPPSFNVGTIRGGDQPSTVAARCLLRADRRSVPGESYDGIVAELRELLAAVEAGLPGLSSDVRRMPGGMATLEHRALVTPADHPLVRAAAAARELECGAAGELTVFPAWTDAALLASFAGIPAIVLGPGDLGVAHSPRESVAVEELLEAARLYAATALCFCDP